MDPEAAAAVVSQLVAFAELTTDFVGVSDPWGRIQYLNEAAKKRIGVADVTGLTLADIFPPDVFGFYYDVVRPELLRTGAWSGEVLVNAAGTGAIPMYVSTIAILGPGGETNGGVVYAHELSRVDPTRVAPVSDVDEVSGLLHRSAFDERVRNALAEARRGGEGCALVLADIAGADDTVETFDEFTAVNVMRALGGRLTRLARTIDIVGRVGERQLGLLLRSVRSHAEALRIARLVRESLVDPPIATASGGVIVSVACGVAFSEPGDDPDALIRRASTNTQHDIASSFVDDASNASTGSTEPAVTLDDFRVALSHGHMTAYAQPVVDLRTERVVGYRGLARWHHQTLGILEAEAFIGMIADTSLANEVDLYIARETAAVVLLAAVNAPARLYAPVSTRLIADIRTEQYLCEIADAFFLSMPQIRLQLARPLVGEWSPNVRDAARSLREADVALVLTGVESASDVTAAADLGFCELHLSRKLTETAASDSDAMRAVSDIVRLAHDRGLIVAATGVDRADQRDAMIECGCDLATGGLYGAPVPTNTIEGPDASIA